MEKWPPVPRPRASFEKIPDLPAVVPELNHRAKLPSFNIGDVPQVTATVGEPVELKYRSVERDTERIMEALSALLPEKARQPYEPTEEELARTFPAGKADDLGFTDR